MPANLPGSRSKFPHQPFPGPQCKCRHMLVTNWSNGINLRAAAANIFCIRCLAAMSAFALSWGPAQQRSSACLLGYQGEVSRRNRNPDNESIESDESNSSESIHCQADLGERTGSWQRPGMLTFAISLSLLLGMLLSSIGIVPLVVLCHIPVFFLAKIIAVYPIVVLDKRSCATEAGD